MCARRHRERKSSMHVSRQQSHWDVRETQREKGEYVLLVFLNHLYMGGLFLRSLAFVSSGWTCFRRQRPHSGLFTSHWFLKKRREERGAKEKERKNAKRGKDETLRPERDGGEMKRDGRKAAQSSINTEIQENNNPRWLE